MKSVVKWSAKPLGWAIVNKTGEVACWLDAIHGPPPYKYEIARCDRDWPGVAPHRTVQLVELTPELAVLLKNAERYQYLRDGGAYVVRCNQATFYCGGHRVQPGAAGYPAAFDAGVDEGMDRAASSIAAKASGGEA